MICLFVCSFSQQIDKHLKKIGPKFQPPQIPNIDFLYTINLDQRKDKWEKIKTDFQRYGLELFRFSAIYGWHYSLEDFQDLGIIYGPGMWEKDDFPVNYNGYVLIDPRTTAHPDTGEYHRLGSQFYGKNIFSVSMKGGAIGCTMSHLSVLQDALDSGYRTIWVMEDDIVPTEDPRILGDWIDRLDQLVGPEGWDILYTNFTHHFKAKSDVDWIWRPDIAIDHTRLLKFVDLGDFIQINGRPGTYSMIIRQSGMEKILGFLKRHGLFSPFDMELSTVPDLKLFNMKRNVITVDMEISDTVRQVFQN